MMERSGAAQTFAEALPRECSNLEREAGCRGISSDKAFESDPHLFYVTKSVLVKPSQAVQRNETTMTRERKELRIDTMDTLLELRDDVSTMLGSGASSLHASQADAAASDTPSDRDIPFTCPVWL